jgi:hypothetical protein
MASLPNLGGLRYTPHLHHRWDTAQRAFRKEQSVLNHFDAKRLAENSEVLFDISEKELLHVWTYQVAHLRKGRLFCWSIRQFGKRRTQSLFPQALLSGLKSC